MNHRLRVIQATTEATPSSPIDQVRDMQGNPIARFVLKSRVTYCAKLEPLSPPPSPTTSTNPWSGLDHSQ